MRHGYFQFIIQQLIEKKTNHSHELLAFTEYPIVICADMEVNGTILNIFKKMLNMLHISELVINYQSQLKSQKVLANRKRTT